MNTNKITKTLSVVIPVYNGEKSIFSLVSELVNVLKDLYSFEVVLVNDGSPDNSDEECIRCHQQFPDIVQYHRLARNFGEHQAVMAGLAASCGEFAVIIDDDFQNPISEIQLLVDHAIEGSFDVVYSYYKQKEHTYFRNLGSKFNDRVANWMLKKPKDLYLSSFKVINRFLINEIIQYDMPFPYIDGLILRTTNNIGKKQVLHQSRREGKSNYTIPRLVSVWLNMFTNFSILPLRTSIVIGLLFSLIAVILGFWSLIDKLLYDDIPLGWTALMISVVMFGGVQLIAIGVIGEYIGRIFLSQNKKPQYVVRQSFMRND